MADAGIAPRQAALTVLFAGLTAMGAFIRIPLPLVPLTLQTAAVLLSGIILGPRLGALSQIVYLVIGLMGAPIFAHGGGPGYVLNPTFGYLVGFSAGAAVTGAVAGDWRRSGYPRLVAAMFLGLGVIYLCGGAYLYWNLLHIQGKEMSFVAVAKIGWLVPLPGGLIKILLLLPLIKILRKRELFVNP